MSSVAALPAPFHFGPYELFGMYHPPTTQPVRGAVLLCPPLGVDQVRSHRLYRQLARALADAGLSVLRFDCFGSGDSPGDSRDVDWDQCVADTTCAADELRRRSKLSRILAFGVRLGGSMALCAAKQAHLAHAVVWDPVCDGKRFVHGMDALQQQLRSDPQRFQPARLASDAAGQWLGFPVSECLHQQLSHLALGPPSIPVDWLRSNHIDDTLTCGRQPAAGTSEITVPQAAPWEDLTALDKTLLAPELVKTACACLRRAA